MIKTLRVLTLVGLLGGCASMALEYSYPRHPGQPAAEYAADKAECESQRFPGGWRRTVQAASWLVDPLGTAAGGASAAYDCCAYGSCRGRRARLSNSRGPKGHGGWATPFPWPSCCLPSKEGRGLSSQVASVAYPLPGADRLACDAPLARAKQIGLSSGHLTGRSWVDGSPLAHDGPRCRCIPSVQFGHDGRGNNAKRTRTGKRHP